MSDQPKPFVHAEILAAWSADPEGVKIEYCGSSSESWKTRVDARHAPALHPDIRYRATLRDGTVIESPEPKWEAGQFTPESPWIVRCGEGGASSGALIYPDAPDAEATAHMIAARWNGEAVEFPASIHDERIVVKDGVALTQRGDRIVIEPNRPHIPEGYEYMPGAVLPKPLTFEEACKRDTVYRPGMYGVLTACGNAVAEGVAYYATREQAQQVFDAQRRRREQ